MSTDVFLFANTLHNALQAVWDEATLRPEVDQDALFALWARFEAIHDEIGRCLGRYWGERGEMVAALRGLEAHVQDELQAVRAGMSDAPRQAV